MKILAAEDNPVFQTTLRSILTKWGYEVILVGDGNQAWSVLQADGGPRLAILDWMMPGLDGPEVCRRLRAANREPYVYVLLLTARAESQDLVEGMEAGADDYLTKPLRVPELRARLRAGRRIVELQEELMLAREALRQQATHDGLTGLLNRSAILEVLHNELARAQRESQPLSLLMVDLDHFKQVNDEFGHLAGDAVLREASSRMRAVVRRYDSVGRYGGEEFLVVLPGCDSAAAAAQAERLRLSLSAASFVFGTGTCPLTGSVGYVCSTDVPDGDAESLIRLADDALYAAKNLGRNRSASAQTEMIVQ
jgi:two-component system, cell cycle response regulator